MAKSNSREETLKKAILNLGPEPKLTDILNILLQLVNGLGALDQSYENLQSLKVTINADMNSNAVNIFTRSKTAGTPVPNKSAVILAASTNGGNVWIGDENVDNLEHGFLLEPGAASSDIKLRDISKLYIWANTTNDVIYLMWGW